MAEQDRLAALLERATRERRGGEDDRSQQDETGDGSWEDGSLDLDRESERGGEPLVRGGEWLPSEPATGRHRDGDDGPRVLTVPASLRSVDVRVRPGAVVAVIVVVLLVGAIFGVRWWWAERTSQPVPIAPAATTSETAGPLAEGAAQPLTHEALEAPAPGANGTPGADGAQATTAEPQVYLVHVDGAVRAPGVVQVEVGARVQDAVDAAGGFTAEADTTRLNLARPVGDGERLWVPRPGEDVPDLVESDPGGPPGQPPAGGAGGGSGAGGGVQVNLNSADQAALEELPGVGPVTAAAIIQWRTEHGRFSTTDELLEVSGIGEATLDKLLPHITL
ncbi:helix-hairpin-helix domain-containing protein [Ornithinimicrobium cryptoxanthini]|uniref:helix-hairpin-helix domain-containing protein n=1 Tax=Ornithinimicrobium cryptoxanthini TaxID=2934161 RepID=UPI0021184F53|nr:helix-hairpin-helix domain-containing protein [Ornithinimicrobium cryptoxanthini]